MRDSLALGVSAAYNAPIPAATVRDISHVGARLLRRSPDVTFMSTAALLIEPGPVTTVTLNRPDVRNSKHELNQAQAKRIG